MSDNTASPDSKPTEIINRTLAIQSNSITALENTDTVDQIHDAARLIHNSNGQVTLAGIGKSGDIAKKIASTFNSIGIPSRFIHPVEAFHGDIGVLSEGDVVILISNSGNTEEMVDLLEILNRLDPTVVAITSDPTSRLGQRSDHHIDTKITEEGAVVDLVPMSSTTVTIVIGDCIANILMYQNDFSKDDFGQYHPGGAIGKKLNLDVCDVVNEKLEPIDPNKSLLEASLKISEGKKGIIPVVDDDSRILGVVTDGDLRREISRGTNIEEVSVEQIMTTDPVTLLEDEPAIEALELMEQEDIGQIVLLDNENRYRGIVHMRDLVREGIA